MTCKLPINCCLCAPAMVFIRDAKGRFLYGCKVFQDRKPSPYFANGRLTSAIGRYTPNGATPHREYCPGYLERMGIKIEVSGGGGR